MDLRVDEVRLLQKTMELAAVGDGEGLPRKTPPSYTRASLQRAADNHRRTYIYYLTKIISLIPPTSKRMDDKTFHILLNNYKTS